MVQFYGLVRKARLRDPASWMPLAAMESSRNLEPTFMSISKFRFLGLIKVSKDHFDQKKTFTIVRDCGNLGSETIALIKCASVPSFLCAKLPHSFSKRGGRRKKQLTRAKLALRCSAVSESVSCADITRAFFVNTLR